jgi:transposase
MSLYLIQAGLISLDEDQDVQQFLLSYLSGFRRAAQVGAASVLAEILTHYRLPEDYRAWRKYVGKTIKGLVATQKRQDRTIGVSVRRIGPLMIPEVAGRVGLSRETLYRQVRRGQVRAEKVNVGTVSYLALSDTEVEQLKKEQEQKQLRKALIAAWANKQGISKHSARQWVRRQERQGLGIKEMSEKIGREWLKRAVHSLSQESKV